MALFTLHRSKRYEFTLIYEALALIILGNHSVSLCTSLTQVLVAFDSPPKLSSRLPSLQAYCPLVFLFNMI
jgi:hypothetical protein